jgi:ATP-dependent RNA helicase RhlE
MSFESLGLSESLLRAVRDEGYTVPTPIQVQAVPHILQGKDLMGCAQTGTGKTAAFALPTLQRLSAGRTAPPEAMGRHGRRQRPIRCLVLSPTRELAAQIGQSVATYGRHSGLRHTVVFGGVGQGSQVKALQAGVDILVATPGRLLDLMEQGFIRLDAIEILILDEADQMLDLGFFPALKRIVAQVPRRRQTLMFSATMPEEIRRLASAWLVEPVHVRVTPVGTTVERVEQLVYSVEPGDKPRFLTGYLKSAASSRTLVFTRTKHGADKVVKQLVRAGIHAAAIHGNKSQNVRQRVLAEFKSSRPPVLVATDIAARGLDIDNISHVINYDVPNVPEVYVHRIGRTARAGAEGIAISLCSREERAYLRSIERLTRQTIAAAQPQFELPPREAGEAQRPHAAAQHARHESRPARPAAYAGGKPSGFGQRRKSRGWTRGRDSASGHFAAERSR